MGKEFPRFRDISISKKMFLILTVTFLIPLVVAGFLLVWSIGTRDAEYETQQDIIVLEGIARELRGTPPFRRRNCGTFIAKGLVKSIIIFEENRVIFERRPAPDSDIPSYPEDIQEAIEATGVPYWALPREMNYFSETVSPLMIPIYRTLNSEQGDEPLVLFTGLRLYVIVFLAVLLGICFTGVCLIMQRHYIFTSLKTMLAGMDEFRKGNLPSTMSYQAGDEIERINREIEGIFNRLHNLIREVYVTKIYNQEATLRMLTSQINHHFLYNTLDSIRWKAIRNKDPEVGAQIEALSDLFHHVLNRGDDLVTVDQEIKHLETYLYIMNFRYGDRVICNVDIPRGVRNIRIPKLILQPIVENAIIHGIEKKVGPGEISVRLKKQDELLVISISDNGKGIDPQEIKNMLKEGDGFHEGFALKNIEKRIKLCYGEEYGLEFFSDPKRGTEVRLSIPLKVKERKSETPYT
ncbi:MAG: sensor histidine kinase [Treponema sp.]|jgi:signal transduction histidine kinase|nr:sensor histidine kinase [Treponema sp.]